MKKIVSEILVVLSVLDKLKWNIEVYLLGTPRKTKIPKIVYPNGSKLSRIECRLQKKTEKVVAVFNFGSSFGQKAPSIRNYIA
jgi:hypothetical protein